jgi:DUF3047 family protein
MRARIAAAMLALAVLPLAATTAEMIEPGLFSAEPSGGLPRGWVPFFISRHERQTEYRLVKMDGVTVVRAEANASASALLHRLTFDPKQYPLLHWRWKVENLLAKADIRRKEGDDFPARLYVLFDYDLGKLPFAERTKIRLARVLYGAEMPGAALCYVWDNKTAPGSILPSAYTDRVRLVVLRSGPGEVGRWVTEERNLYDDFRAAFGEDPPNASGLVIATDTDNTGERAVAYFGDIELLAAPR